MPSTHVTTAPSWRISDTPGLSTAAPAMAGSRSVYNSASRAILIAGGTSTATRARAVTDSRRVEAVTDLRPLSRHTRRGRTRTVSRRVMNTPVAPGAVVGAALTA